MTVQTEFRKIKDNQRIKICVTFVIAMCYNKNAFVKQAQVK